MSDEKLKSGVNINDLPTGKFVCGFKMSEVFNLPVSTDFEVCQIVNIEESALSAELKYKYHVFSAINNHDRLEQENAELREALQSIKNKIDTATSLNEMEAVIYLVCENNLNK